MAEAEGRERQPVTRIGEQWSQARRVREAVEHYLGAARELSREIGILAREKAGQGLEQAREAWGVVKERLGLGVGPVAEAGTAIGRDAAGLAEKSEGAPPEGSFLERHRARPAETMSGPSPEQREREGTFEGSFLERRQAGRAQESGQGGEREAAPRTLEDFRGAGQEPQPSQSRQRQAPEAAGEPPAGARDDLQALADEKAAEALARYEERQARALSERADKLAEAALARLAEKQAAQERREIQERQERERQERARQAARQRQRGHGQER